MAEATRRTPPRAARRWGDFQALRAGGASYFPASPPTIRSFVEERQATKKPATVRRYVATIARAHTAAGLLVPASREPVRLALKEMGRRTSARQRQALALGWKENRAVCRECGWEGLRSDRERALLCVAYDTMARRRELVAFNVEEVEFLPNGSGTLLIRRSKTDQGRGGESGVSRRRDGEVAEDMA